MDVSPRLSGEEWQRWAERLLYERYGSGEYQKVPDNHKGDAGIEGFTISSCFAYQMYGPEEPLSTEERYKKHRIKITDDIGKFIKNKVVLQEIFGNVKIKRWILLVPIFDSKEIVIHAAKKTEEVLKENLPYVDTDFRIFVEDEDGYSLELPHKLKMS